jgi:hypothetical protein
MNRNRTLRKLDPLKMVLFVALAVLLSAAGIYEATSINDLNAPAYVGGSNDNIAITAAAKPAVGGEVSQIRDRGGTTTDFQSAKIDDVGMLPEDPLGNDANFYAYAIGAKGFLREFNTVMVGAAELQNETQSAVREQTNYFGEYLKAAVQTGARGNLMAQDVGGRTDDSSTWTAIEPCAGYQRLLTGRRCDVASNQALYFIT